MATKTNYERKTWKDQRNEFVEEVASMLDRGIVAWRQEWQTIGGETAHNPVTNTEYKGGNYLRLMIESVKRGYTDPRFVTFNQAQEKGWHIKKGAKGIHIEKAMKYDKKTKKQFDPKSIAHLSGDEQINYQNENVYFMIKNYVVFNAQDIEGIPNLEKNDIPTEVKYNKIDKILENSGVSIKYGGNQAYYQPTEDFIVLPKKEAFTSEQAFYSTALHELSHSTGHSSRLNRDLTGKFGSEKYAKEELIAEMGGIFTGNKLGFIYDESVLDNSKAYLSSWAKSLRDNKNLLFECAKIADGVSNYIIGLNKNKELNNSKEERINNQEQPKGWGARASQKTGLGYGE